MKTYIDEEKDLNDRVIGCERLWYLNPVENRFEGYMGVSGSIGVIESLGRR